MVYGVHWDRNPAAKWQHISISLERLISLYSMPSPGRRSENLTCFNPPTIDRYHAQHTPQRYEFTGTSIRKLGTEWPAADGGWLWAIEQQMDRHAATRL